MASQHFGRSADASRTLERTPENRANTGIGRIGRLDARPEGTSRLLDEIAEFWSGYMISSTDYAAEILTITAAASHLLNIPDPEGEEIGELKKYRAKVGEINKSPLKPAEKRAAIEELGPEPKVSEDPRLKEIKDEKGLYFFPIIAINAPVEGCGKSNAASALKHLSRRTEIDMFSTNASVREAKAEGYGIIMDEAQRTFHRSASDVRAWETLLNSSFSLNAAPPRKSVVVDSKGNWGGKKYPQFGMLALAGIGIWLPRDNASRVIWINMIRDERGPEREWDDRREPRIFAQYGKQLSDALTPLQSAAYHHDRPMPAEINGRLKDKWSPLIITADLVGGRWPDLIRDIAVTSVRNELSGRPEQVDERAQVYADLEKLWREDVDRLESGDVIRMLKQHDPETYGWIKPADDGGGRQLGTLLRSSDFRSPRSRTSGSFRGWFRADLEPGWRHYKNLYTRKRPSVHSVQSPNSRGSDPSTDASTISTDASITKCDDCWRRPATRTVAYTNYCDECAARAGVA